MKLFVVLCLFRLIFLNFDFYAFSDTVNFLGISIVGQSNKGGDGGIYVGSIMKGSVPMHFSICCCFVCKV